MYLRAHERDIDLPYSAIEKRVGMRPDDYTDKFVLLGRDDDGTAVAGGTAELPLRDNTGLVYADAFTLPEHRRRGHGTAVIEAIEEIGRDAGRSTLFIEAVWELDDVDPASQAFAEGVGFTLDLLDAMRELALPATLPPLEVADGYSIHSWRSTLPGRLGPGVHGRSRASSCRRRPAATSAWRTSSGTSLAPARRSAGGPSSTARPR